jgi:hypothetical protein
MKRKRKRSVDVEFGSMAKRVSIGSVKTRYEDGEQLPAINVKPPPLYHRMPDAVRSMPESYTQAAFERVARDWWDMVAPDLAQHHLHSAFKGSDPQVRQVGRSGGWLVVEGLGDPAEWTVRQDRAWDRFEKAIKKSMFTAEKRWHEEMLEMVES